MSAIYCVITALLFASAVCDDQLYNFISEEFAELEIVNGTSADEGEFPFAVSLRYNNAHLCGGTILNAKHILTAAHCVCTSTGLQWYALYVTVQYGVTTIQATSFQSIAIEDVTCRYYNPNAMYIFDVAILTLSEPIPEEFVIPVVLEDRPCATTYQLDEAQVIGWGRNETDGYSPTTLQKVDVVIYNDTVCSLAFTRQLNVYHHVCSGWPENGRGSCQGDSGGPLLVDGRIQVGIVSFGASGNCGISNSSYPKVLSRVSTYIGFIKEIAGDVLVASEYLGEGSGEDGDEGSGNGNDEGSGNGNDEGSGDDEGSGNNDDGDGDGNGGNDGEGGGVDGDEQVAGSEMVLPSVLVVLSAILNLNN